VIADGELGVTRVRLRVRRRIIGLGLVATLAIGVSAFMSVGPLQSGQKQGSRITDDNREIQQFVELRTALAGWQFFVEPQFATFSNMQAKLNTTNIATAAADVTAIQAQIPAAVATLRAHSLVSSADQLHTAGVLFAKATTALGPLVAGAASSVVAATIAAERTAFMQVWNVATAAANQLRQIATTSLANNRALHSRGRTTVLFGDAALAIVALGFAIVYGQRGRRTERVRGEARQRRTFETVLQDALDMAKTEPDAYTVMTQSLRGSVPDLQSEVLVADSSRAHFHRTLTTVIEGDVNQRDGCGVASPLDCPATTRGHTLQFPSSRALNACPYLQNRQSGACSAVCVPISIAGKTVGVTHATGPDRTPATETDVRYLELTARRVSERVGMLRAFAKSETQARSDPLTGLLNRRSLENQVHNLERDGTPYALAYGDLDHFKVLNDTHGHEAGDQALRLFARVLRDSVRPNDIVSRYGGEEFVIVLPDCDLDNAVAALERLRERLALTLASGRVPAFTASFGVSQSTDEDTFDETVASADRALLDAKTAGRNRVTVAHQPDTPSALDLPDHETNHNPTESGDRAPACTPLGPPPSSGPSRNKRR
jgi:diguanylate cyclase (GGDEF)-like protein